MTVTGMVMSTANTLRTLTLTLVAASSAGFLGCRAPSVSSAPDPAQRAPEDKSDPDPGPPTTHASRARAAGSPFAYRLNALWISADEERGWAMGDAGTVIRLDGTGAEAKWSLDRQATALTDSDLTALTVSADGQRGWAGTWSGIMLRLEDGRWARGEPNAAVEGLEIHALVSSDDDRQAWAIARDPDSKPDSACRTLAAEDGHWAMVGDCADHSASWANLYFAVGQAWLRTTDPCREGPRAGFGNVPRYSRWQDGHWLHVRGCLQEPVTIPGGDPSREAAGWHVRGRGYDDPRSHGIYRLGPDREHVLVHATGALPPLVLPGLEHLPLTILEEAQLHHPNDGAFIYRLEISVPGSASKTEIEAALDEIDRQEMTPGHERYDRLFINVVLNRSEHEVASLEHLVPEPPRLEIELADGSLSERLLGHFAGESPYTDIGYWTGCPDPGDATVETRSVDTEGFVTLDGDPEFYWTHECVFAVADAAFRHIHGLDTLVVRLQERGEPFIEVRFHAGTFFELDALTQMYSRDYGLHDLQEDPSLNRREREREEERINAQWHRDVTSKLDPADVRFFRGWDPK